MQKGSFGGKSISSEETVKMTSNVQYHNVNLKGEIRLLKLYPGFDALNKVFNMFFVLFFFLFFSRSKEGPSGFLQLR